MQLRHSRVAHAVPNLLPGEVGINLSDATLTLYADGRKVAVSPQVVKDGGAPHGALHAPLQRMAAGLGFGAPLAFSSLTARGIDADLPQSGLSIPGVRLYGLAQDSAAASATRLRVEPFTVVSTGFDLTRIGFNLGAPAGSDVLVGVYAVGAGRLVSWRASGAQGVNALTLPTPVRLPPGRYLGVIWCAAPLILVEVEAAAEEAGWDYDAQGAPLFVRRRYAQAGDFSAFLPVLGSITPETSAAPGEARALLYGWTLASA